jgi:hypothetical protein
MIVYISGPMSGIKDYNYPAFFEADAKLFSQGYHTINPAKVSAETLEEAIAAQGDLDWEGYMRIHLAQLTRADAICVLPGWQKSRGSKLEVAMATALGLPVLRLDEHSHLVPRVRIIGIAGYARSGKDTAAEVLTAEYGYTRYSLADRMREAMVILNPLLRDEIRLNDVLPEIGWDGVKANFPLIRELLQKFGTEVGREMFGTDFWVDQVISNLPDGEMAVIPDVRFPNEFYAVKKNGGEVWRVTRPGVTAVNGHISEVALDQAKVEYDYILENDGSIEDLKIKVLNVYYRVA